MTEGHVYDQHISRMHEWGGVWGVVPQKMFEI